MQTFGEVCSMVDEEAQGVWPSCLGKRNLNHGFDIVFCVYFNIMAVLTSCCLSSQRGLEETNNTIGRSTVQAQQVI